MCVAKHMRNTIELVDALQYLISAFVVFEWMSHLEKYYAQGVDVHFSCVLEGFLFSGVLLYLRTAVKICTNLSSQHLSLSFLLQLLN